MADRGRYKDLSWTSDFRRSGRSHSKAQRYKAFIPAEVADEEPALKSSTGALCERAGTEVRNLNSDISGLVSLEGMGRQLLRSEALASSRIEGLSISHKKLAEAELDGRKGHHRALEILGTIKALERATEVGTESRDLTLDAIAEIHKELAIVPPLDEIAGEIREEASWIGGSAPPNAEYVAPPHEHVRPLLDDLCEFMNRDDISPIPQAAIAHAQFELIHPFGDGNGRVGRCLIHVLFRRRRVAPGYVPPISLVLGANKDAYIAGLQAFRAGKTDQWIAQFARAVETAAAQARKFSAEVAGLQDTWRKQIGSVRSDAAVLSLIDSLPKYPIVTAAVAEKEIGRSRPATIDGLARLEGIGALRRHRNQKKGDSWEAKGLFKLLSRFEDAVREA
ncbi:MAG TPA: Fic family protein [Solirubrobacterales bacterium]